MRKKEEQMKEKEKEEKLFMCHRLCVSACQSCYNALIREQRSNLDKETKEHIENWKDQVATKQKCQVAQLKNLRTDNNEVTAEIKENGMKLRS